MSHNNVLGIIGAGQLALFSAQAAQKHEIDFIIYAENDLEPAALAYPSHCIYGAHGDEVALKKAFEKCTHVTLENEFWSPQKLSAALSDKIFCPDLFSYKSVYGKIEQRKLMHRLEVAQPKFHIINDFNELKSAFYDLNQNVVLKKNVGGYDGTGNFSATDLDQLNEAAKRFELNNNNPLLLEERLNLTRELALTFFATNNTITFWPAVETIQDGHVCTNAISPADLSLAEGERLEHTAKLLRSYGLRGLFTLEFFRCERGPWFYNEIAPRPHNSQHLSMVNCEISQYDAIAYWVKKERLPKYIPMTADAAMVNILGKKDAQDYHLKLPELSLDVEVKTYMYGKKESRSGRKLGHLAITGPRERILQEAKRLAEGYEL